MTDTLRDRIIRIQAEHIDRQLTNYDADGREPRRGAHRMTSVLFWAHLARNCVPPHA